MTRDWQTGTTVTLSADRLRLLRGAYSNGYTYASFKRDDGLYDVTKLPEHIPAAVGRVIIAAKQFFPLRVVGRNTTTRGVSPQSVKRAVERGLVTLDPLTATVALTAAGERLLEPHRRFEVELPESVAAQVQEILDDHNIQQHR